MLFLDAEFNGHGGELISIGLISTDEDEFYEVVALPRVPHAWVTKYVIPKLGKKPVGIDVARKRLLTFLEAHSGDPILADWPADFEHLLGMLYKPGDQSAARSIELSMYLLRHMDYVYVKTHNALEDARALRDCYMEPYVKAK